MELRFGEWLKTILRIGIPIGRKKKKRSGLIKGCFIYTFTGMLLNVISQEKGLCSKVNPMLITNGESIF